MKIGDVVVIAASDSILDCCAGKRGRIAHLPAKGEGFMVHTDHFCPIVRQESELTVVDRKVLAQEVLDGCEASVRASYEEASLELLREYEAVDEKARAVLVLRGLAE